MLHCIEHFTHYFGFWLLRTSFCNKKLRKKNHINFITLKANILTALGPNKDLSSTAAVGQYTLAYKNLFLILHALVCNVTENLNADQSKVDLFLRPVKRSKVLKAANKLICK